MRSGAVSPPSRILSVVAEVEERSLATPTSNKGVESPLTTPTTGAGSVNREESTQGMDVESEAEGDDDTLPLI